MQAALAAAKPKCRATSGILAPLAPLMAPAGSTSSADQRTMAITWSAGVVGQMLQDQAREREEASKERQRAQELGDRLVLSIS